MIFPDHGGLGGIIEINFFVLKKVFIKNQLAKNQRLRRETFRCDRHRKYAQEFLKRVEILKIKAQSHLEYSDKTPSSELHFLFQMAPENVFQSLRQYLRYLGNALDLADCVRKKN